MRVPWYELTDQEQATFRVVRAFVEKRLETRDTIEWALKLGPGDKASRLALLEAVDNMRGRTLGELWRSAWRLIEESWEAPNVDERASLDRYSIQTSLKSGERSGILVAKIVDVVRPYLKVEIRSSLFDQGIHKKTPIKTVDDLFRSGLTSRRLEDPNEFQIDKITEPQFLYSLAVALDAVVISGLEISRRNGWLLNCTQT